MRPLRPGQDIVLSSREGAVDCRVLAAAGRYVLLQPQRPGDVHLAAFLGTSSLTYLEGMVPMGWDGEVQMGSHPGELRFIVNEREHAADRRSAVRIPVFAQVTATPIDGGETINGHVLDVSAGGMRFRHPGRFAAGTMVRVYAELPGGLVIDADAETRGVEQGVTSVMFHEMRGASSSEIGFWTVSVLRAHLANG